MVFSNRRALFRQYSAGILSQLAALIVATQFVWLEPLTMKMVDEGVDGLKVTPEEMSLLIALMEISGIFSTIPAGYFAKRFGRKAVCCLVGPLSLLSTLAIIYTRSLLALYMVRVLQGVIQATVFTVCPMYIAEISDPSVRGSISSLFQISFYAGSLFAYCVGHYLSYDWYAASVIPFQLVHTACCLFYPETPHWLLTRGRDQDAMRSLQWYRAKDDVTGEFDSVQKAVTEAMVAGSGNPWKTLFTDTYERKAFQILQIVMSAKYLSGFSFLITYSSEIFTIGGSEYLKPSTVTIGVGTLQIVFALLSGTLSDRVGRKTILVLSSFGCFVSHLTSCLYFYLLEEAHLDVTPYVWLLYCGVLGYHFSSGVGYATLLQTLQGELFGPKTRELAAALTQSFAALLSGLVIIAYPTVVSTIGIYANFLFYSLISVLSGILLGKYMFETAGKPIGRMEDR